MLLQANSSALTWDSKNEKYFEALQKNTGGPMRGCCFLMVSEQREQITDTMCAYRGTEQMKMEMSSYCKTEQ